MLYKIQIMGNNILEHELIKDGVGIYMNVDAKTERGTEILKYAIENKLDELSQKFNPSNVELNKDSSIPINLIMKIDSRPFDDFVYASEDEKLNLAEYVYEKEQELLEYFMNLAEILEPITTAA